MGTRNEENIQIRMFSTKQEMEKAHRDDWGKFPIVWAFSDKQFDEGAKRLWNFERSNPEEIRKIVSIGAGGYILSEDVEAYKSLCKQQNAEERAFAKDLKSLVSVILSAMDNHEYSYTRDKEDTMFALQNYADLPYFAEAWKRAEKKCLRGGIF